MNKILLAVDEQDLEGLIIANGYDEDFIADIEKEKADAQKMVEEARRETIENVIETISQNEGWEETEDFYRKKFGLPTVYEKGE
jgi:hypothetical protein